MPRDKERQKEIQRRYREKIKEDPERLELYRAKHAKVVAQCREKIKADPALLELQRALNAEQAAASYAKMRSDPLRKELAAARRVAWRALKRLDPEYRERIRLSRARRYRLTGK